MRLQYFLAKRFIYNKNKKGKTTKRKGVRIATFGIAIGLAVMIISVCVVIGFKKEVSAQVVGFGSHIQILSYDSSSSFDRKPISVDNPTRLNISQMPEVDRVEYIVTKPGIIKTDDNFKAVVFKGVDSSYDWRFFRKNLIEGNIPDFGKSDDKNKMIISDKLAKQLKIGLGDEVFAYFFQQQVRARKFKVSGIYSTTYSDFDNLFVLCRSQEIQTLNGWDSTSASAVEITLKNFDRLDEAANDIQALIGNRFDKNKLLYNTQTIKELYPQIFNWLDMLDTNAYIILVLMMAVAGFNMISGLLIIILERTQTIGILKALGMSNRQIREVFVINAMFFVVRGMLWGNIVGLLIVVCQYYLHIIPLDPEYYYTNFVPVSIDIVWIAALNVGVFVISVLIMLLPSHIITKISPAKSIRFE